MKKREIAAVVAALLFLFAATGVSDFLRVFSYELPAFCIQLEGEEGGAGEYLGLGYSFEIEGNFQPDAEDPGMTSYVGKVFGIPVARGSRESGAAPANGGN